MAVGLVQPGRKREFSSGKSCITAVQKETVKGSTRCPTASQTNTEETEGWEWWKTLSPRGAGGSVS